MKVKFRGNHATGMGLKDDRGAWIPCVYDAATGEHVYTLEVPLDQEIMELRDQLGQWKQEARALDAKLQEAAKELGEVRRQRDDLDTHVGTLQDSLLDRASGSSRLDIAKRILAARATVPGVRINAREITEALRNADELMRAERES